jgi:hypothetical protein
VVEHGIFKGVKKIQMEPPNEVIVHQVSATTEVIIGAQMEE